jgi:hypothetical protein
MSECCDCTTVAGLLAEVNLNVRETDGGLSVDVTPKDPARAGFLKDLARGAAKLCAPTEAGAACCAEGCC